MRRPRQKILRIARQQNRGNIHVQPPVCPEQAFDEPCPDEAGPPGNEKSLAVNFIP